MTENKAVAAVEHFTRSFAKRVRGVILNYGLKMWSLFYIDPWFGKSPIIKSILFQSVRNVSIKGERKQ